MSEYSFDQAQAHQAQGTAVPAVTSSQVLGSTTSATPTADATASVSVAPSVSLSPTRPPYIPQFTAATQMILKRMKTEPSSFNTSFSSSLSTSDTVAIQHAAYDDARRRLVMSMNTSASLTMQMPVPATTSTSGSGPGPNGALPPLAPQRPKSGTGLSAIQCINSGLTASGKPISKKQALKAALAPKMVLAGESKVTKSKAVKATKPSKGKKRVMDKEEDGDEITTPISASEASEDNSKGNSKSAVAVAPLTTTKSGRQVLKPTTYNPAAMDAATKKRTHYGKRTVEQALCKSCTRMHSPTSNQMVFCDGCNDGWHQLCHSPRIPDDIVRDTNRAWYCSTCQTVKDRQNSSSNTTTKKPRQTEPKKISWVDRPAQQKRAYLSTLPQSELVGLLMTSLDLHPDLPIFPGPVEATGPAPATSQAPGNGKGRSNSVKNSIQKTAAPVQEREDDDEYDPLAPPWPEPGAGIYSRLPPEKDDAWLEDDDDYEVFSHILYDDRGRKTWENGIMV